MQVVGLKKLRQAGKAAKEATIYELREDSNDRSQRKGDLVCDDLLSSGKSTILDVGITYPLIDTNVNNKSTEERGYAANKYGDKKNNEYIGLRLRRNRGGLTVPRGGRPSGPGRVKKKTVRYALG